MTDRPTDWRSETVRAILFLTGLWAPYYIFTEVREWWRKQCER